MLEMLTVLHRADTAAASAAPQQAKRKSALVHVYDEATPSSSGASCATELPADGHFARAQMADEGELHSSMGPGTSYEMDAEDTSGAAGVCGAGSHMQTASYCLPPTGCCGFGLIQRRGLDTIYFLPKPEDALMLCGH
jgi:hypothetical protein